MFNDTTNGFATVQSLLVSLWNKQLISDGFVNESTVQVLHQINFHIFFFWTRQISWIHNWSRQWDAERWMSVIWTGGLFILILRDAVKTSCALKIVQQALHRLSQVVKWIFSHDKEMLVVKMVNEWWVKLVMEWMSKVRE